jgi:MFS-type transporter involved in bile tolerance (Atg22 family)
LTAILSAVILLAVGALFTAAVIFGEEDRGRNARQLAMIGAALALGAAMSLAIAAFLKD